MLSAKSFLPPNLSVIAERAAEKDLQNTRIPNSLAGRGGGANCQQQRRGEHGTINDMHTDVSMQGPPPATRNKSDHPAQQQRRVKSLYHHRAVLVCASPSSSSSLLSSSGPSNLLRPSGGVRKEDLSAEAADTRPLLSPAPVGVASDLAGVPNTLAYYDIESDRGIVNDKDREADIERKLSMMQERRRGRREDKSVGGGTDSPQRPTSASAYHHDNEEQSFKTTTSTSLMMTMGNNNSSKNTSRAAALPSSSSLPSQLHVLTSASSSQEAQNSKKRNTNNKNIRGETSSSHAQHQNSSRSMSNKTPSPTPNPQQKDQLRQQQQQQQEEHNHKLDLASAVRLRSAFNYAKKCCGVDDHWVVTTYQQHVFLNGSRPVLGSSLRHWLLSEPPPRDSVVESLVHSFIEDHFHLAKAFVMLFEGAVDEEDDKSDEHTIANSKSINRANSSLSIDVASVEVDDVLADYFKEKHNDGDANSNDNNTDDKKKNTTSNGNNTTNNDENDQAASSSRGEFSSCKRFCQVNKLSLADVASWLDGDDLYCRDKGVVRTIFEGVIRALALKHKRQQDLTIKFGSSGDPSLNYSGSNVSAAARTSGHLHNTCEYHQPQATTASGTSVALKCTTTTPLLASFARGEGPHRPIEEFRKRLAWFKSDRGILEHVVELRKVMPSVGRGGTLMDSIIDDGGDEEGGYTCKNKEKVKDFSPSLVQGTRESSSPTLGGAGAFASTSSLSRGERSSSSPHDATNGNALVEGAIRFDRSSGDMGSMGGGGQGGVYKSRRPLTNSPSCIMPYPAVISPSGSSGSTVSLTKGARARTFLTRFRTSESYTAAVRASDPDTVYYEKRMQLPPKSWTPDYIEMSRRTWSGKGGLKKGANAGNIHVGHPFLSSNVVRPFSQNDAEVSAHKGNLSPQQKGEWAGQGEQQGGRSLPPLPQLRSDSPLLATKKTVSTNDTASHVTSSPTNTHTSTHPLRDARAGEQRSQGGPLGGWRSRVDGAAEESIAARRMKVLQEEFKVKSEAELRHLGGGGR